MLRPVKLNLVDKLVNYVNPRSALERIKCRAIFGGYQDQGLIVSGSSKRSMRGWNPTANSADVDILPKHEALRASSRDLYYNTPIATGALRRLRTNAIGFGLRLQCRIDREFLGLNDESADAWERRTEREFFCWANSQECDAARTLAFPQLTSLAFFTTILSGDCFILVPRIPRLGQIFDLRIQVVEGDFVCNPNYLMDTSRLASGIEVDEYGAPVAYHFMKPNLGASMSLSDGLNIWIRIPVYGIRTGRKQVFHLYDKERPGQRRGIPLLAPVIEELKQMTRLSKAELQAAIINSFYTVFVKSEAPSIDPLSSGFIPASGQYSPGMEGVSQLNPSDERDEKIYEMGSGNIVEMNSGDSIELADPRRPNLAFEPFFMAICKQIGSSIQIPFEQLILHFSASYSAARAALQEAWKFYRERRLWASDYFCKPIYEEWLTEAVLKGRIQAPGFFDDPVIRFAWCGSTWSGPGQGQLDPLKETKASALRIQNRLSTHEDEYVAIQGGDWESSMHRLGREETFLENLGLKSNPEEEGQENESMVDSIEEGVTT